MDYLDSKERWLATGKWACTGESSNHAETTAAQELSEIVTVATHMK